MHRETEPSSAIVIGPPWGVNRGSDRPIVAELMDIHQSEPATPILLPSGPGSSPRSGRRRGYRDSTEEFTPGHAFDHAWPRLPGVQPRPGRDRKVPTGG